MQVNVSNLLMLVGVVHGGLLSALLIFDKRDRKQSNFLLTLLLVFYTLPLLKVTLLDLGISLSIAGFKPWPMELLYGLGPSLFLYAKTVREPKYQLSRKDGLHFLPVILELLYYLSPLYRPGHSSTQGVLESPYYTLWVWQQIGATASILIYLGLTNHLLWSYSKSLRANHSDASQKALRWLQTPVRLYSIFFFTWLGLRAADVLLFSDGLPQPVYYPSLLFLSMSTYWIGTKGYLQTQTERLKLPVREFASSPPARSNSDPGSSEDNTELKRLFRDLNALMHGQRPYLKNDLGLTELAEMLSINPRLLSKVINTQAGINFYDYINRFRIESFQTQLQQPDSPRSLLNLAYACGFGSKATFNHVFKKETGLTPSQYRQQLAREGEDHLGRSPGR